MKRLFKFKYPKLAILLIIILFSYILFSNGIVQESLSNLGDFGYISIFIAGILFAFGFTAPISIGLFITLPFENILVASIIGGIGAMIGDMLIFYTIRISFMKEFESLKNTRIFKSIIIEIEKDINKKIRNYLLYIFMGIVIASPLPDEIGVTMLAGLTKIKQKYLILISFILNTIGIFLIIYIFNI